MARRIPERDSAPVRADGKPPIGQGDDVTDAAGDPHRGGIEIPEPDLVLPARDAVLRARPPDDAVGGDRDSVDEDGVTFLRRHEYWRYAATRAARGGHP